MKIILILTGLLNAAYLYYLHLNTTLGCALGDGCREVITSIYAKFFGVPISAIGISLYLVLLIVEFLKYKKEFESEKADSIKLLFLTPAAALGIILFGVQFIHINSFCPFCSLNSLILVILFILSYQSYLKSKIFNLNLSTSQWVIILAIGLLPIAFSFERNNRMERQNVIGNLAGETLTIKKFKDSPMNQDWKELKQREYNLKKQLFHMTLLELHAKKQNISVQEYIEKKIIPTIQVTDIEIKSFYEKRKSDMPKDKSFDELKNSIKKYLVRQKEFIEVNKHIKTLFSEYDAKLLLTKLEATRIKENPYKTFSIGKKSAPIHIIEFSDLECGHCKKAYVAMKGLIQKFKGDIYFEYRHYPLPFHPFAKKFAKASVCAGEQKKFFEYIEISFANQKKLSKIQPVDLAERLNLDKATFESCMNEPYAQNVVDADFNEGNRLEVESTPTFFINGYIFVGIPTEADLLAYY